MSTTIMGVANSRSSSQWADIKRYWFDIRFLQLLCGLMDVAAAVQCAEKHLQAKDINFVVRDTIMRDLRSALEQPPFDGD